MNTYISRFSMYIPSFGNIVIKSIASHCARPRKLVPVDSVT